jgi:hypothetical protein
MMTIEAQHAGVCGECAERIHVGDRITRTADDRDWRHEVCPVVLSKFDFDASRVCGECFTVRSVSGACACPN